jgi:BioD-like phosphotransacetylase family protein
VASLLGLAGIIVTEGQRPDEETIERARREGVILMLTPRTTFEVVSKLASLGIQGQPAPSE